MTAVKSGLMIIDQHRAHVRVLFEEYLDKMAQHRWMTQKMLFPEILRLSPTDAAVMRQMIDELSAVGFSVSDLGGDSFSVNGVPADIEGLDAASMLNSIVTAARERVGQAKDELGQSMALSMARGAAIPYGQVLSNDEMENLVNRLFSCSNVNMTPDGKPILCILQQEEIEHLLG